MSEAENKQWQAVCSVEDIPKDLGVRALLGDEQVAIFKVNENFYAVSAIDPFTKAAVLSHGIIGDLQGKIVVASPLLKQHFVLETGECLEDDGVSIKTYGIRNNSGKIELAVA